MTFAEWLLRECQRWPTNHAFATALGVFDSTLHIWLYRNIVPRAGMEDRFAEVTGTPRSTIMELMNEARKLAWEHRLERKAMRPPPPTREMPPPFSQGPTAGERARRASLSPDHRRARRRKLGAVFFALASGLASGHPQRIDAASPISYHHVPVRTGMRDSVARRRYDEEAA